MSKSFSQFRKELNEAVPAVASNQSIGFPKQAEKIVSGKTLPKPQISGPESWGNIKNMKVKPTTLGAVGKSALGAAGRLASKYSPHATALATGYEVGKSLNNVSGISKVTDKIGKGIASGLQKMGIGKAPEVVKAKEREVSRKPADTGPKTTVPAQSGGGTVSFPAKSVTAAKPSVPEPTTKTAPIKPSVVPVSKTPSKTASTKSVTPVQKTSSSVKQLQQNLIKKGANIKADGIMGPKTKAAMKGFGDKSVAKPVSAPVKKTLPVARKVEADPNVGKGMVTGRAYGSKKAGITSTENRFGSGSKQTFMTPTPRKDVVSSVPQKSGKAMGTASVPRSTSSKPTGGKWM